MPNLLKKKSHNNQRHTLARPRHQKVHSQAKHMHHNIKHPRVIRCEEEAEL